MVDRYEGHQLSHSERPVPFHCGKELSAPNLDQTILRVVSSLSVRPSPTHS